MKTTADLLSIPSFAHQNLRVEFTSLRHACPPGIYLTIDPKDPLHWPGVIFIRYGPYAGGVFKFSMRFPTSYPRTAPIITFTTFIFHPLVVPFTSPAFPGEFSLKGFEPSWFPESKAFVNPALDNGANKREVVEVLRYLRNVLSSEEEIREIPSWAVANSTAMRAWRDGEWKERVKQCVEESKDNGGGERDLIRFPELPEGMVDAILEGVGEIEAAKN